MSLASHLAELRRRILYWLGFWVLAFALCLWQRQSLFDLLAAPLAAALPGHSGLIAIAVTSAFTVPIVLSLYLSLLLSMPFGLLQFWLFARPALYAREVGKARLLFVGLQLCFLLGVAFAFFLVIPLALNFLIRIAPAGVEVMPDIHAYLRFSIAAMLAFALAFELPVVMLALIWLGLVRREFLIAGRRYAIAGSFLIGMLATPPDVLSQFLLAIPLYLLYEAGLLISRVLP